MIVATRPATKTEKQHASLAGEAIALLDSEDRVLGLAIEKGRTLWTRNLEDEYADDLQSQLDDFND